MYESIKNTTNVTFQGHNFWVLYKDHRRNCKKCLVRPSKWKFSEKFDFKFKFWIFLHKIQSPSEDIFHVNMKIFVIKSPLTCITHM